MRKQQADFLVKITGGRTHIQHSIDNLVALPIFRKSCIKIVGPIALPRPRYPICGSDVHCSLHTCSSFHLITIHYTGHINITSETFITPVPRVLVGGPANEKGASSPTTNWV